MSRVFIHIGSPKTGSTSFQDYVFCNKNTLYDIGLSVSEKFRKGGGDVDFRKSLTEGKDKHVYTERKRYSELFKHALNYNKDVLISSELLWSAPPKKIISIYPELENTEVVALAVLRDRVPMIASHYKQYVKTGGNMSLSEFMEARAVFYDYEKIISQWSHFFKTHCLDYDNAQNSDGGVVKALVDKIISINNINERDTSSMIELISKTEYKSNKSISDAQALMCLLINQADICDDDKDSSRKAIVQSIKLNNTILKNTFIDKKEISEYCLSKFGHALPDHAHLINK